MPFQQMHFLLHRTCSSQTLGATSPHADGASTRIIHSDGTQRARQKYPVGVRFDATVLYAVQSFRIASHLHQVHGYAPVVAARRLSSTYYGERGRFFFGDDLGQDPTRTSLLSLK